MTAALTIYTTYADIRAALGVSAVELSDATLGLALYADYMQTELEDIELTLPATIVSTKALPTPSDAQLRFLQAARLFATFSVAKQLSSALPLFTAKQVGDSKAVMQRFDNPYKDTINTINQQYDKMRTRLATTLAALGTAGAAVTAQVYLAVSAPQSDRVTGT